MGRGLFDGFSLNKTVIPAVVTAEEAHGLSNDASHGLLRWHASNHATCQDGYTRSKRAAKGLDTR
jgi:hypothetical protein